MGLPGKPPHLACQHPMMVACWFAFGQENRREPIGRRRQPEEDRLIRRPQRRSEGFPQG